MADDTEKVGSTEDFIGQHITWKKISGKPDASMIETDGFGCLSELRLNKYMRVSGDYGVVTSAVRGIEIVDSNTLSVKTENSTYHIIRDRITQKRPFFDEPQKENERLQEELEQAQKDIEDFERLALEWKKGYDKAIRSYEIRLNHAEQTIEELRRELEDKTKISAKTRGKKNQNETF